MEYCLFWALIWAMEVKVLNLVAFFLMQEKLLCLGGPGRKERLHMLLWTAIFAIYRSLGWGLVGKGFECKGSTMRN